MSNHGGGFHWPQHMVDRMVHLYTVDGWSCGLIADELGNGLTRCAIIGKLYRLKVSRPHGPSVSKPIWPEGRKRTYKARNRSYAASPTERLWQLPPRIPKPRSAPLAAPLNEPLSLGLTFLELTKNTCKWPHGEGPFTFCGHAITTGRSYCAYHCGIAFVDVPRKANPRPFRRAA